MKYKWSDVTRIKRNYAIQAWIPTWLKLDVTVEFTGLVKKTETAPLSGIEPRLSCFYVGNDISNHTITSTEFYMTLSPYKVA